MLSASLPIVCEDFLAPVLKAIPLCPSTRLCRSISDENWIRIGLDRVLQESPSGRGFLQRHSLRLPVSPTISHYFHSLRSERRLRLLEELTERICSQLDESLPDKLQTYPLLENFDIFAGDGHWHQCAAHDIRHADGKRYPAGHFYCLNLRNHTLRRLATAQGRKEHDMHVLKRLSVETLRQRAPKGRKVLYVWDKASIDFTFWYNRKASGVYFITLEKDNLKLNIEGIPSMDRSDPINNGVLKDELVSSTAGFLLRRVTYERPDTGEVLIFLTNEMSLPPGLIAHLYHRRWNVEKVFDSLKNKYLEKKAWATSQTAKAIQAEFLCLTHNLALAMEHVLASEKQMVNEPDRKRRFQRQQEQKHLAKAAKRLWPSTWDTLLEPVHCSVKLVRWLGSCFLYRLHWEPALCKLRELYAEL